MQMSINPGILEEHSNGENLDTQTRAANYQGFRQHRGQALSALLVSQFIDSPPPRCSHGNTHTKAFQNSPLDSQDPLSVHLRSSNKTQISPPTELKQRDLFPFPRLIIQLGNFIFFFHSFTTERKLSPELRLLWIIRFLFSGVGIIEG